MSRHASTPSAPKAQPPKTPAAKAPPASPAPAAAVPHAAPTNDDIRRRAYAIYQARAAKGVPGTADSDWTQAERELRS